MEACLRKRPEDPRAWRDYLTMLQSLGEIDAFNASLARVPGSAEVEPEIWLFRGQAKERDGDWAGAAANLRQALELNPNLLNAHYRLAMVEDRMGHREESAAHRKRWQQLREARTQLRQAEAEYQAALVAASAGNTGGPSLRDAISRLASICETLGWARAAEGWNQIAVSM
jgi:tetratricopeptide (TPR) repeat protein